MLEYLLENENQIIVKEDGEELARLKYEVEDGIALVDSFEFSSKYEENMNGKVMEYYFSFFESLSKNMKNVFEREGVNVQKIILKDFKTIKDLDNYLLNEKQSKDKIRSSMR